MAATVSWERLRELAGFRTDKGCAISLYLNVDPSEAPTAADVDTRINSLLGDLEKQASGRDGSHGEREALKADVDRIRSYFEDEFDRDGVQGVAVFSSTADNFWRALRLAAPVPDELRLAEDLYLAPLVPLMGRGEGALVVVVGRERGEVYRLRGGTLEVVAEQFDEQPGQHDQGGWSQGRFQRHIEKLVAEHLKSVGEEIDRHVRRMRSLQLVIVCPEEMRSEVEQQLSKEAQEAIAGWATAESHAGPADLLELATPLLEEARNRQEADAIERWREEAGRNGRAASGWESTLEAASDGRVELLLYQQGADRPAYQCPACGRGQVTGGNCPLDGRKMERHVDGLDLALHQTLAHGGSVWAVRQRQDLEPVEGIGALLRY